MQAREGKSIDTNKKAANLTASRQPLKKLNMKPTLVGDNNKNAEFHNSEILFFVVPRAAAFTAENSAATTTVALIAYGLRR